LNSAFIEQAALQKMLIHFKLTHLNLGDK
jgi:hypothetical protein